jgi:hypothetical protein
VEPLDLAGGRGAAGGREQVIDPVLAADPVEQHLGLARPEPAREDLAVVGQDLLGDPVGPHRLGEVPADGPAGGADHHPGAHDEPRVVVDAGQDLARGPVGEQDPAHDVELPQLHGLAALPAAEPAVPAASGLGIDQPGSLQRPVDPRTRRDRFQARPGRLVHEPSWSPIGVAPSRLEHPHLDHRGHLMRAPRRSVGPVGQTREPLILVAAQPPMHRLAGHAEAARHLHDWDPIADHREHRLIPLFHHTQLHQHARECVADQAEPASPISRSHVTPQPEPKGHASGGAKHVL